MASVETTIRVKRGKKPVTMQATITAISADSIKSKTKHLISMTPPPPTIMESNGRLMLTTRLPSLKPPRDLMLGGRNPPKPPTLATKKQFVPNLNVVRNKNTIVKTSKDTTRGGRGGRGGIGLPRGGRGGRGRGGAASSSSLIQTTGLFSEGAGAMHVRKSSGPNAASYSRNESDSAAQMRRPTYVKAEDHKVDLKEEAAQLYGLLGESDDDDLDGDKLALATDNFPVKLNEAKWKGIKREIKVEVEQAIAIKEEPPNPIADDNSDSLAIARELQRMHVQEHTDQLKRSYPTSIPEFLAATSQRMFLLQLPDMLPSETDDSQSTETVNDKKDAEQSATTSSDEPPSTSSSSVPSSTPPPQQQQSSVSSPKSPSASSLVSEDAPAPAVPQATSVSALSAMRQIKSQSMNAMQEGQIGKLVRYKSGKTKLVLGQTMFDLELGMETGFLQHLMSINTNAEERSGNMINLGNLHAKITATPDWDQLLQCSM